MKYMPFDVDEAHDIEFIPDKDKGSQTIDFTEQDIEHEGFDHEQLKLIFDAIDFEKDDLQIKVKVNMDDDGKWSCMDCSEIKLDDGHPFDDDVLIGEDILNHLLKHGYIIKCNHCLSFLDIADQNGELKPEALVLLDNHNSKCMYSEPN